MDKITIFRQLILFMHIIVFALAIAAVLREDWRLLFGARINRIAIKNAEITVQWSLLALWISGLTLVYFDVGFNLDALINRPKLAAKLIVVSVLTLNGLLLHRHAFPLLLKQRVVSPHTAIIIAALGAISTVSWLYASFVGVARLVSPAMSLNTFIGLYLILLGIALGFALFVFRHRLERLLILNSPLFQPHRTGRQSV